MKLAVGSVSHYSVHSPIMVWRHILDWRLQSDQRFKLSILHDGPIEGREDRISLEEMDLDVEGMGQIELIQYPERRKSWGAHCRKEWLASLDPVEFPYVFFCCADDQVNGRLVETVFREMDENTDMVMWLLAHHHYGHKPIPLGTWPTLSRCDWASGAIRTEIAQKAGINEPDEYAGDGFYWQDCFAQINQDTSRLKILDNFLVVKN